MRIHHKLSSCPMTNYQPSQFEMRNCHGLTSSLMRFSFHHSLKILKQSKLLIKKVKNLLPMGDQIYHTKPRKMTYHYSGCAYVLNHGFCSISSGPTNCHAKQEQVLLASGMEPRISSQQVKSLTTGFSNVLCYVFFISIFF
jgi:hypothetical protein